MPKALTDLVARFNFCVSIIFFLNAALKIPFVEAECCFLYVLNWRVPHILCLALCSVLRRMSKKCEPYCQRVHNSLQKMGMIHVWLLCDPVDYSPPGSSVQGLSQARILEWIVISFFKGSLWPRDQTCISCIGRQVLYYWATREGRRKWECIYKND